MKTEYKLKVIRGRQTSEFTLTMNRQECVRFLAALTSVSPLWAALQVQLEVKRRKQFAVTVIGPLADRLQANMLGGVA